MLSFDEAMKLILGKARLLGSETVPLAAACGRVLARDVVSDVDMPPFDKSAMDGYACRREDLPGPFRVIETIQAGVEPLKAVGSGECAKIMTGARVPQGADCVLMVEHTENDGDGSIRFMKTATETNICFHGEDVRKGEVVLRRGTRLDPRHIAVLAAAGCVLPEVACRPGVGIIATGGELVEPDMIPGTAQIRNSNSAQIRARLEQACAAVTYYGIVPDEEPQLDAAFKRALAENDVVVFSGGVSMGDFDFVPEIMARNGIEILFDAIAVKPGKPTTFGVGPSVYCFGLPGNPVSTFMQCEVLVKPFLYALMGHAYQAPWTQWPLADSFSRTKVEREAWIPVVRTPEGTVLPKPYHGSAHSTALVDAYGFMVVPQKVAHIQEGTLVRVWPL